MDAAPPVVVRVKRQFAHRPDRVFDAWIDAAQIGQWMFGHVRDEEVVRMSADVRVGGAFSFLVRRQGKEVDHVGTYLEIDRPRRLVFTWGIVGESAEESRVCIDIAPLKSGCELSLTHEMDPRWADYASRTAAGWTKILESLSNFFGQDVSGTPVAPRGPLAN